MPIRSFTFLPFSLLALASSLVASCASTPSHGTKEATAAAAGEPRKEKSLDVEVLRVTDRVFSYRHNTHMNLVLDTEQGWVVMDPMNLEAARALAKHLKATAPQKPLALIAYSHFHLDHAGGAQALLDVFGPDVPIVANKKTPEIWVGKEWAKNIASPTVLIDPPWSRNFGDLTLELQSVGPNHSGDMLIGWVPEEKVVYIVDFMSNDGLGYEDLPGAALPEYWESQRKVLELPFEHATFGHGVPGDRQSVEEHADYWDEVRAAVRDAIEKGLTEDQAAEQVKLPKYSSWSMYELWFPMNVRAAYRYEKAVTSEGAATSGEKAPAAP